MATALADDHRRHGQDDRRDRHAGPNASPAPPRSRIRPISVNDDEEWFVMFHALVAVPRPDARSGDHQHVAIHAWDRGRDNPLFTAGDLIYNGVIIREVPEMPVIAGAGAGGIDVAMSALCGAQALGVAPGRNG